MIRRAILLGLVLITASAGLARGGVGLVNFERGFPLSTGKAVGFLPQDREKGAVMLGGARGTGKFGRFFFIPGENSAYLQRNVRRKYLATGSTRYRPDVANALSLWLRVPQGSHLISREPRWTFGLWTYHWAPGDRRVGGANNTSGTTDSMMHGYADLWLVPGAEDRWVNLVLSESAFRIQRDYYYFYAARGVTGALEFFSSLRQLQFTVLGRFDTVQAVDLDEIELVTRAPTAQFVDEYARRSVPAGDGDVAVPVQIRNPTTRTRRYRFFVSSCLGASREALGQAMARADSIDAPTAIQKALGARGGLGAAELAEKSVEGWRPVPLGRTLDIPAGGVWKGALVHHIRPEMLGPRTEERLGEFRWWERRNTLTTSVLVWDPGEPSLPDTAWVRCRPSNSDDADHDPPPGFPKQVRPPEGWRSEDVPIDQVGGYFVSEITLE